MNIYEMTKGEFASMSGLVLSQDDGSDRYLRTQTCDSLGKFLETVATLKGCNLRMRVDSNGEPRALFDDLVRAYGVEAKYTDPGHAAWKAVDNTDALTVSSGSSESASSSASSSESESEDSASASSSQATSSSYSEEDCTSDSEKSKATSDSEEATSEEDTPVGN